MLQFSWFSWAWGIREVCI